MKKNKKLGFSPSAGSARIPGVDELTGAQRKYLRGLAHDLKPVVQIGKGGISERLLAELKRSLEGHELVKVKFLDLKESKRELCPELARQTGSHWVGLIGNVAIFFRPREEPSERRIRLP